MKIAPFAFASRRVQCTSSRSMSKWSRWQVDTVGIHFPAFAASAAHGEEKMGGKGGGTELIRALCLLPAACCLLLWVFALGARV
jgi:hypothetical protein